MVWKSIEHDSYFELPFIIVNTLKVSACMIPNSQMGRKRGSVSLEVSWKLNGRYMDPMWSHRGKEHWKQLARTLGFPPAHSEGGTQREWSVPPRKEGRARVASSRTHRLLDPSQRCQWYWPRRESYLQEAVCSMSLAQDCLLQPNLGPRTNGPHGSLECHVLFR